MIDFIKLKGIAEKYHINTFYLFGSYYDGTYDEGSDIDIAYLSKSDNYKIDFYVLYDELREIIGKEIDLIDLKKVKISFAFQILKNSKIIYNEDDEVRTDFEDNIIMKYLDFSFYEKKMIKDLENNFLEVYHGK